MSSLALAEVKGADFKEKFLFTSLKKTNYKENSGHEISKCFKFHKISQEILQTYQSCRKDPKLPAPLDEAMGTCIRKDGANAYFFEDMKECEAARAEWIDSFAN